MKPKKYQLTKRKAFVGETISIVDPVFSRGRYDSGDEFIVKKLSDSCVIVTIDGMAAAIHDREYAVIEPLVEMNLVSRTVTTRKLLGITVWRKVDEHFEREVIE